MTKEEDQEATGAAQERQRVAGKRRNGGVSLRWGRAEEDRSSNSRMPGPAAWASARRWGAGQPVMTGLEWKRAWKRAEGRKENKDA